MVKENIVTDLQAPEGPKAGEEELEVFGHIHQPTNSLYLIEKLSPEFRLDSAPNARSCQTQDGLILNGLSYKTSDINLRERFSRVDEETFNAVRTLAYSYGAEEVVLLGTCNRVELLTSHNCASLEEASSRISRKMGEDVFARIAGIPAHAFNNSLYTMTGTDVVRHLFRVASGLESMMLGEPQILGQVKQAYQRSQKAGTVHSLLNRLFHRAFQTAKLVRTRTRIGHQAVSYCYAARSLAEKIFGEMKPISMMLLGAGEMGILALRHFQAAGVARVYIANRTNHRAEEVAEAEAAVYVPWSRYADYLSEVDIIVSACSNPGVENFSLDLSMVKDALARKKEGYLFIVDLSVPRSVQSEINMLEDVFLFNLDDLQDVVQRHIQERQGEVLAAEAIVEDEVRSFCNWWSTRELDSSIGKVVRQCDEIVSEEVKKSMKRLKGGKQLGEEEQGRMEEALRAFGDAITARVLSQPIRVVKSRALIEPSIAQYFEELLLKK